MRSVFHPSVADLSLASVLYALSDPVRLQIVRLIAQSGERPCGTFGLSVAKTTLSHHLKTLREAGVIAIRAEGTQRFNSLRRDDLDYRFPGLLSAVLDAAESEPVLGTPTRLMTPDLRVPAAAGSRV